MVCADCAKNFCVFWKVWEIKISHKFNFSLIWSNLQSDGFFRQEFRYIKQKKVHIKRKCKTCLGQNFKHMIYLHICDQG